MGADALLYVGRAVVGAALHTRAERPHIAAALRLARRAAVRRREHRPRRLLTRVHVVHQHIAAHVGLPQRMPAGTSAPAALESPQCSTREPWQLLEIAPPRMLARVYSTSPGHGGLRHAAGTGNSRSPTAGLGRVPPAHRSASSFNADITPRLHDALWWWLGTANTMGCGAERPATNWRLAHVCGAAVEC